MLCYGYGNVWSGEDDYRAQEPQHPKDTYKYKSLYVIINQC